MPAGPESLSAVRLAALREQPLTYAEVGCSLTELPAGYARIDRARLIGTGRAAFSAAADRLLDWRMQLGAGLRVRAESPRVAPDGLVELGIGLGPLRIWAPCRVLRVIEEPDRRGFSYGTLPGHPEIGEEAFLISLDEHDQVWQRIRAFSRPGPRWARMLGPIGALAQQRMTDRYLGSLA